MPALTMIDVKGRTDGKSDFGWDGCIPDSDGSPNQQYVELKEEYQNLQAAVERDPTPKPCYERNRGVLPGNASRCPGISLR